MNHTLQKVFMLMALFSFCFHGISFATEDLTSEHITAALETARLADKIPGLTYAVFNKNGIIAKGQTGASSLNQNPDAKPLNVDQSIFRIGSVSKLFTTLAVSRLIEKNYFSRDSKLLDLDKTLAVRVLKKNESPARLAQWDQIQIHHLMSHQAGISKDISGSLLGFNSESLNQNTYPSLKVFYKNLTAVEFLYPAGQIDTHFKYSNLAFNMLGRVVEAYNPWHLSYSSYVTHSILGPLGMTSTYYDVPGWKQKNMVIGHGSLLPDGSRIATPKAVYAGSYEGSMGIATTAPDLAHLGMEYLKIIYQESKFLSRADVIEDMLTIKSPTNPTAAWASGPTWLVMPGENAADDIWFGHQGTGPSERAVLMVNAERNLGVSILFNCSDAVREKYLQLIIKQLKVDHPELFAEKIHLAHMANQLVANAREVLAKTPAPINYTPAAYPAGLDVQKYVGQYFADLAGTLPVTFDAATGYLMFMGQKLAYDAEKGDGHFRMPMTAGSASTNTNKEPIVFNINPTTGKVDSFLAFNIAIFRRVN